MKITPFITKDYVEIVSGGWCVGDPEYIGSMYERSGPAFTVRVDSSIIVVAGVSILWGGVGEAWSVFSALAAQNPIIYRHVKQGLTKIIKYYGLWRIQTLVMADFKKGERMISKLGFKHEVELLKFGPKGETFNQFVMFPPQPVSLGGEVLRTAVKL